MPVRRQYPIWNPASKEAKNTGWCIVPLMSDELPRIGLIDNVR